MELDFETDETVQPTSCESIGTSMYDVSGRATGKRCGHGECKMLNGPKDRKCKTCKRKLPNRTVNWNSGGLMIQTIEHDRYWAAVRYAGINGKPGKVIASDWIHMGWGMGVCPGAGGAGCKGVMRKRTRDKGRGALDADKEKAGGRARLITWQGKRRKFRTKKHKT